MSMKLKSMSVAATGVALAVVALSLSRHLGASSGVMIVAGIVMQFVALALLARDRREAAAAAGGGPAARARRRPF